MSDTPFTPEQEARVRELVREVMLFWQRRPIPAGPIISATEMDSYPGVTAGLIDRIGSKSADGSAFALGVTAPPDVQEIVRNEAAKPILRQAIAQDDQQRLLDAQTLKVSPTPEGDNL